MRSIFFSPLLAAPALLVLGGACATLEPAPVRTDAIEPAVHITLPARAASGDAAASAPVLTIRRVAHASVLSEVGGVRVLTDPWFTETSGYRHGEPLGIALKDIGDLTAVVVSHAHYDHYDMVGFAPYPHKDVPMIVMKGTADAARDVGFTNVKDIAPWQGVDVGGVKITATPGAHSVDENTYIIETNGYTIFFGGDSLLIPAQSEVAKRFPHIDVAFFSVNGLTAMGSEVVMNAQEAAQLCGILQPAVAVPIHYMFHGNAFTDTFILGYHGTPMEFRDAALKACPKATVLVTAPGQPIVIDTAAPAAP